MIDFCFRMQANINKEKNYPQTVSEKQFVWDVEARASL